MEGFWRVARVTVSSSAGARTEEFPKPLAKRSETCYRARRVPQVARKRSEGARVTLVPAAQRDRSTRKVLPMFELLPPKVKVLKPLPSGPFQISAFPHLSGNIILNSFPEPIAVGPASTFCTHCYCDVTPMFADLETCRNRDEEDPWIMFPCHESECEGCNYVESEFCSSCEQCIDCCGCKFCHGCEEMVSSDEFLCGIHCNSCCDCNQCEAYYCGSFHPQHVPFCHDCNQCEDYCSCQPRGRCDCETCQPHKSFNSYRQYRVPGWIVRGDVFPSDPGESVKNVLLKDQIAIVHPRRSMADFYLLDFVLLVTSKDPATRKLAQDAKRLQDHIVSVCDPAFRDYGFAAIGGELRYHPNVGASMPSSRQDCWNYWSLMGETVPRSTLLADAVEIFGDVSYWGVSTSVGGEKWRQCAEVCRSREAGEMDPKTFVDRCFSLQHNGGSFLNKVSWCGEYDATNSMQTIGNAHSGNYNNNIPDFSVLLTYASTDVRFLVACCARLDSRFFPGSKPESVPVPYAEVSGSLRRSLRAQYGASSGRPSQQVDRIPTGHSVTPEHSALRDAVQQWESYNGPCVSTPPYRIPTGPSFAPDTVTY